MKHGDATTWVGRSIRRLEDPVLLRGAGRFTADLPAQHYARFVRSPVAAGRILRIEAPEGAVMFTAADLAEVKPIRPMLYKFGYVPITQPVLAGEVVRYLGDPVAVVLAAAEEVAEDIAESVVLEIDPLQAVTDAVAALVDGAPIVRDDAPGNMVVDTRVESAAYARCANSVDHTRGLRHTLEPAERLAHRAPRGACGIRRCLGPGDADLHDADAAHDAHHHRRSSGDGGGGSAGDRARCRRRVRAEDVTGAGIRRAGLAGAAPARFSRLGRGPAREPDVELPQPRYARAGGGRRSTPTASC